MKEFHGILRSDRGHVNCSSHNLVYFHSGILSYLKGIFIKVSDSSIIYFCLTDINIKDCDNFIFSLFAYNTHIPWSSSHKPLLYL